MTSAPANRVNILEVTRSNNAFRREVMTGTHEQIVAMTLAAGEEIGEEVHPGTDQLFVFVDGRANAIVEGETTSVGPNDLVFVHAGTRHNIVNAGDGPLRLITVYAPPQHEPGTLHRTKEEADAAES